MKRALILGLLVLVACTPQSEPQLDGAPKETPAPSGPIADDGSLAGGLVVSTGEPMLPGVLDVVPPTGTLVVKDCEKIIAADYDKPPSMTCAVFPGDGVAPPAASGATDAVFLDVMAAAGWKPVGATGAERYFERPKGQTDCADVAVLTVLEGKTWTAVLKAAGAAPPLQSKSWRAYSIPASTHEACGADRMKP